MSTSTQSALRVPRRFSTEHLLRTNGIDDLLEPQGPLESALREQAGCLPRERLAERVLIASYVLARNTCEHVCWDEAIVLFICIVQPAPEKLRQAGIQKVRLDTLLADRNALPRVAGGQQFTDWLSKAVDKV